MEASGENGELQQAIQPDPNFAPDWPEEIRLLCARLLEQFDGEEVQGRQRLGDRAFDRAPEQLEAIRSIVHDLSLERWHPRLAGSALGNKIRELVNVLEEMVGLSSNQNNFIQRSESLTEQLDGLAGWFQTVGFELAFTARVREAALDGGSAEQAKRTEALETRTQEAEEHLSRLMAALGTSKEAVNQARAAAGESAATEQANVFKERGDECEERATRWLRALSVSLPIAAGIAVGTFLLLRPDEGAKEAHQFAGLGLWLFVLGLLAFAIRVCAQSFRTSRHLAAVARSKEASISTFQQMIASVEDPQLRSSVTLVLAQSVFAVEDTGLADGSGDHVTMVERAIVPYLPKG